MKEVRHKRKNTTQIKCLLEHFERNPVWNYQKKLHIAESLGMTLSQVSKWNWDERKKKGMCTQRTKATTQNQNE